MTTNLTSPSDIGPAGSGSGAVPGTVAGAAPGPEDLATLLRREAGIE
jgi:hypothetical protein